MAFWDNWGNKKANTTGYTTTSKSQDLNRIWSQAPKHETTALPELYHQTPRLDAVELIANAIANAPWNLYRKADFRAGTEERQPIYDHPFLDMMERPIPNFPEIDGIALKKITVVLRKLLGEVFWIKVRIGGPGSKIKGILLFPPAWCITVPTATNRYFTFMPYGTTSGKTFIVPEADVIWFKELDLADPYGRGRGRTEAIGDELDTDELAAKYQKNFYYNNATPPMIINIKGADQAAAEQAKQSWFEKVGGWINHRKPIFFGSDSVDVKKLSDTNQEMDFIESRKYIRDVFLQHYSIPPELMGILEHSNRSTIDSAYYLFGKNVILPELGLYERTITNQLIIPDYDKNLCLKIDFVIPEDEAFRLQVANSGIDRGLLTRAEWKKTNGYEVKPGDDVYIIPFNLQIVPANEKPKPETQETGIEITDDTGIEIAEPEKSYAAETKSEKPSLREVHWKMADRLALSNEGAFRQKTKLFADKQKKLVIAKLDENQLDASLDKAFAGGDEALMHAYAPAWLAAMTDGARIGHGILAKKGLSFDLYNKAFDAWIQTKGLSKAKDINTTTYDQLKKKLQEIIKADMQAGTTNEEKQQHILETIEGVYNNMTESRAMAIARTETMSSINFGQVVVYKSEGVEQKEWLSTIDSDARNSHMEMNGVIVGIDDDFEVPANYDDKGDLLADSDLMQFPGSGEVAGQIINCRCSVLPVLSNSEEG